MTTADEGQESRALRELTALYCEGMASPTAAELDRGRNALLARLAAHREGRRRRVRWSSALCVAGAVCALVALKIASTMQRYRPRELPPLAFRVDGGTVLEGGYLRESGHTGMTVLFNEGTRFALAAGTRGRVHPMARGEAQVTIEHGTASVQVTPDSRRAWLVDVGPFLVTVKGTVFTVSWDPLAEQFQLTLRRGRVVVSGPLSAGEIALRTGQRLEVNLARAETTITEANLEDGASRGPPVPDREEPLPGKAKPARSAPPREAPAVAAGESGSNRRWSLALARGRWDSILADVDRAGVEATLGKASSEDLFALADAARYRRRPELARAALLAAQRRFPDSPRALDVLFLLGRVEETREGGTARAIAWYDEYLARAPRGPFAGEALGRKMTLTDKLGGPAPARPIALDYLRRFPVGSYAKSARALLAVAGRDP